MDFHNIDTFTRTRSFQNVGDVLYKRTNVIYMSIYTQTLVYITLYRNYYNTFGGATT
jgi:hypothetical protein